jgi:hypothetical protein
MRLSGSVALPPPCSLQEHPEHLRSQAFLRSGMPPYALAEWQGHRKTNCGFQQIATSLAQIFVTSNEILALGQRPTHLGRCNNISKHCPASLATSHIWITGSAGRVSGPASSNVFRNTRLRRFCAHWRASPNRLVSIGFECLKLATPYDPARNRCLYQLWRLSKERG